MKKYFLGIAFFIGLTFFILNSCKKENPPLAENAAEKFSAIGNRLDEKIETIGDSAKRDSVETEEHFTDQELSDLADTLRLKNTTETETVWKSEYLGVFRPENGSCGSYATLDVFMDCEDDDNLTVKSGWVADNTITNQGNIQLHFCLVPASGFARLDYASYAVLKVEPGLPEEISEFMVKIHNESSSNINESKNNGSVISNLAGYHWNGSNSIFKNNPPINTETTFDFYYFPIDINGVSSLPYLTSLARDYGVLSTDVSSTDVGFIESDDEDSGNHNMCWKTMWDDGTSSWGPAYTQAGHGLTGILYLYPGASTLYANSKWYFSKAS